MQTYKINETCQQSPNESLRNGHVATLYARDATSDVNAFVEISGNLHCDNLFLHGSSQATQLFCPKLI